MNLYGFKYIHRGENKGCFYNPQFKRGDFEAARCIARFSTHKKKKANTETNANAATTTPITSATITAPAAAMYSDAVHTAMDMDEQLQDDVMEDDFSFIDEDEVEEMEIKAEPSQIAFETDDITSIAFDHEQEFNFDIIKEEIEDSAQASISPMQMQEVAQIPEPFPSSSSAMRPTPFNSNDIYAPYLRPSALTARIGFNVGMLRATPTLRDGSQNKPQPSTYVNIAQSFRDDETLSFNSDRTFNPRDGLPGLSRNNISIDDLLSFLAKESNAIGGCDNKKPEIVNAFNLW